MSRGTSTAQPQHKHTHTQTQPQTERERERERGTEKAGKVHRVRAPQTSALHDQPNLSFFAMEFESFTHILLYFAVISAGGEGP